MTSYDAEFADLMQRVQQGSNQAAEELHKHYASHILRAVRRKLHERLRSKFDSTDFVQDVWKSFFTVIPEKHAFQTPQDLVAFLTRMAHNKVKQANRTRTRQQKFNVERELPIDALPCGADSFSVEQATPSEILMDQEAWARFLSELPASYRRVFALLREGKSSTSIAQELNLTRRAVNRIIRANYPRGLQ